MNRVSFLRIFLLILCFILSACGGGGSSYDSQSSIVTWQSYSASPAGAVHYWDSRQSEAAYSITSLPFVASDFRSGYAFVVDSELLFMNLASKEQYALKRSDKFQYLSEYRAPLKFSAIGYEFDSTSDSIMACDKMIDRCIHIDIYQGTFPYVFAEHGGKVVAVTNWGDAVLFDGKTWCRMARTAGDIFVCTPNEPMVVSPRVIQFYSSIKYHGYTLLGEWPTGSIYTFDGDRLRPSEKWTPPSFRNREPLGYEAQSMANYCGDLFVGYWPKGEIWRFDHIRESWGLFARVFSDDEAEDVIPFLSRQSDILPGAFFGQRITALVPFSDGLYVATSNLGQWGVDLDVPFVPMMESEQYGRIHRIYKPGCWTDYPKSDVVQR